MRARRALRAGVGRALAAGLLALAASGASGRAAEAEAVSPDGRFRVSDAMIPMRDGVRLHTKIFTPKDQRGPLPIILLRTPYGIDGAAGNFDALPARSWPTTATSSCSRTSAASSTRRATFVMQRPARAPGRHRRRSTRAPTPTTPSTGCSRTCRSNNGRVGMLGVSYDGWTTIMGALEPHPGAQGDLAAGLAGRHVAGRRLPSQRRVPPELRLRVRRDDGERQGRAAVRVRPLRHLRLVPEARPARQRQREVPPRARSRPGTTSSPIRTTTSSGSGRR